MTNTTNTADLRASLIEARDWFESQAKAVSKGCGSSYELNDLRVQRDALDAALAAPAQAVAPEPVVSSDAIHPEIQATLATLDVPVVGYLSSHSGALHDNASKVPRFESAIPLVRESDHRSACEKIMAVLTSAAPATAAPAQAGEYPKLPEPAMFDAVDRQGNPVSHGYSASHVLALIDADRAARGVYSRSMDLVRVFWQQHTQSDALSMTMAELHTDVELVIRAARGATQAAPVDAAVKPAINVGTIGHVGSGRTTLTAALGKLIAAKQGGQ